MRFDFTVHADNAEELNDALGAIRSALPADIFARARPFSITAFPTHDSAPYPAVSQPPADTLGSASQAAAAPAAEPAKRHRRTKEQIAADEAAAKAKAVQDADPLASTPEEAAGDEPDDTDPLGLGTEPEPAAKPATLTPAEAKLKALEVLREVFALPGGPQMVKAIQKQFSVTKFIEVPDAKGLELLKAAGEALAIVKDPA